MKHIKKGIKRQHTIIKGILPLLEKIIAEIKGVKKIIPAKIYRTTKSDKKPLGEVFIKLQRKTPSGFKMIAHGKGSIQEIFVVGNPQIIDINKLKALIENGK